MLTETMRSSRGAKVLLHTYFSHYSCKKISNYNWFFRPTLVRLLGEIILILSVHFILWLNDENLSFFFLLETMETNNFQTVSLKYDRDCRKLYWHNWYRTQSVIEFNDTIDRNPSNSQTNRYGCYFVSFSFFKKHGWFKKMDPTEQQTAPQHTPDS
jgi:hypothetical protein